MDRKTDELLILKAAKWHARLRASECSSEERIEFNRWLTADPAHVAAFRHAERVAAMVTRDSVAGTRLAELAQQSLDAHPLPVGGPAGGMGNSKARRYAVVAACALFGVLAAFMFQQRFWSGAQAPVEAYVNNTLRESKVVLNDGTVMHLDVGGRVTVKLTDRSREVALQAGRAYFEVAHDATRPFSVDAGGVRTVALGTRFEVNLRDEDCVSVTLAQGSVRISPVETQDTAGAGSATWRQVLEPGQQLRVVGRELKHELRTVNADHVVGWSTGRLIFDGDRLKRVLEQFNRYASDKVVLGDESLASVRIGGDFAVGGDSMEFVAALASAMPVRGERVGDHEIALFPKHDNNVSP